MKKNGNFGSRKRQQNRSQNGTEKGSKKSHPPKSNFHTFLSKFNENTVFYRSLWASRADSIVFYSVFTRPEGTENHGPCGQNLGKTLIFVFFLVLAWKMLCVDFGRSKAPNLGPKSGPETMKIGSEKRGL